MNYSEMKLPPNRTFGFFFTSVFFITGFYCLYLNAIGTGYALLGISALFLIVTLTKADLLLSLNKLWMRFGILLGMIVSPIVLGIIFFCLFTPIAFLMRLFRRDELRLKLKPLKSYWKLREPSKSASGTFKNQF